MEDALKAFSFLVFVALGLRLAWTREATARRRRLWLLIGYVLALDAWVFATRNDDWPFCAYRLYSRVYPTDVVYESVDLRAVDALGREWTPDPLSFAPLSIPVVTTWLDRILPTLDEAARQRLASFLLARAEHSRSARQAGEALGTERVLGRLGAPYQTLPRLFSNWPEGEVPRQFVELRIYRTASIPDESFFDGSRVRRELLVRHRSR